MYGDAGDGVLEYESQDGDFPAAGDYRLQAYVEFSGGGKYYGETARFDVYSIYQ